MYALRSDSTVFIPMGLPPTLLFCVFLANSLDIPACPHPGSLSAHPPDRFFREVMRVLLTIEGFLLFWTFYRTETPASVSESRRFYLSGPLEAEASVILRRRINALRFWRLTELRWAGLAPAWWWKAEPNLFLVVGCARYQAVLRWELINEEMLSFLFF